MAETVKHIQRPRRLTIYDRRDPTRTTTIRARYAREMRKRFTRLRGLIRDAIIEKDVFGIAGGHEGIQGNIQIYADSGLRPGAFAFPRVQDKTSSFMEWLEERVDAEILDVSNRRRIGDSIDSAWQNVFIEDTYKRGVTRANFELRRGGFPDIQDIESRGGISAIMGQPFHADRLGVLYTRAFNELKGITDGLDHHITTVLTQGLADGDGPRTIARKLNAVVGGPGATAGQLGITDSLGRFIPAQRRAEILARTETIRAFHHGNVQEMRNWGVEGVSVQAEFRTAGDDRVCPDCASLEGQIYTLDEAQNLLPYHPMCRCIVLPARPGDKTSTGQVVGDDTVTDSPSEPVFDYDQKKIEFNAKLTDEQKQALSNYVEYDTSDLNFEDVNGELRRLEGLVGLSPKKGVNRMVQRIDASLDMADPLSQNINVYRGIDDNGFRALFSDGIKQGDTVKDFGFMSTTLNKESAEGFTLGQGWLFEIKVPRGKKVGFPDHPEFSEMEVLLPRGTLRNNNHLKIDEIDEQGKRIKATWNAEQ